MALEIAILGSVEPRVNGDVVGVPPGKQRALLALLAVRAPQPVSAEVAVEALWPRAAPAEAMRSLRVTVSRLRRSLGAAGSVLETVASGYRLAVEASAIDARRFETLVNVAQAARLGGDPAAARRLLDDALGLWHGPALADVGFESFAQAEIARLEELRVAALEERIDARLADGEHARVVAELEQLSAEYPSRERLVGLLMLALYRCGRQTDALEVYTRSRQRLVDELGLEPSPALRELEQAILEQRGELSAPERPALLGRRALPAPPNRTIGRAYEVATLGERLRTGSARLLTLTGPGGVGKTRLALEIAHAVETDFADGAHFVSLGAVPQAEDVPAAIVKALGIILLSGESADQAIGRFLGSRRLLLVADNCEHVLGAAPFIGRLLGECPGVTVLATSRVPLGLQAEERWPVPPLALPEAGSATDLAALAGVGAVALFCERARARDPEFELDDGNAADVAEICHRVDGLPLAIELAAARCGLLSIVEIAGRLNTTLGALGAGARDAPARQRTLWATIDWSHELLSDEEKACFARFAVFVGGATVDAAEAITGASLETLDRLVAKSLLVRRRQPDSTTRLAMLETIRAYARERLDAAPNDNTMLERHHRYFLALAERDGTDRALSGKRRKQHLARLDADIDNLHAALARAIAQADAERALRLAAALGWYWVMRDRYAEAVDWIDRALSLPGADAHPALRIRALCIKSRSLWPQGRVRERPAVMGEAEALARMLGEPVILSQVLQARATLEANEGRLTVAEPLANEALRWARVAEDEWAIAMAAFACAMAARSAAELHERVDAAAALLNGVGNDHQLAYLFAAAAYAALCLGGDRDASDFVGRAIPLIRKLDDPYLWMGLRGNCALAALMTGDTYAAADAFRDELTSCRDLVALPFASEGLYGLAAVAATRNDMDRAARLVGAAVAHRYRIGEDEIDARLEASFFEPARMRCRDNTWDAAVREGAALSFEDAIAYALEEPDARRPNHGANRTAPAHSSR